LSNEGGYTLVKEPKNKHGSMQIFGNVSLNSSDSFYLT